jgi:polar amino acid transport system substrate-binding protein
MLFGCFTFLHAAKPGIADDRVVIYSPYISEGVGYDPDEVLAAKAAGVLDQAFSSQGISINLRPRPFARLGTDTRDDPRACAAFVSPAYASQEGLYWIGPLFEVVPAIFARDGLGDQPITSLNALGGHRIGALRGTVIAGLLNQVPDVQIEWVTFETQNLEKLLAGRLDYWLATKNIARTLALEHGVSHLNIVYEFPAMPTGLGCNKALPAELLEALTQAATRYRESRPGG